jgi:hypothetical protein
VAILGRGDDNRKSCGLVRTYCVRPLPQTKRLVMLEQVAGVVLPDDSIEWLLVVVVGLMGSPRHHVDSAVAAANTLQPARLRRDTAGTRSVRLHCSAGRQSLSRPSGSCDSAHAGNSLRDQRYARRPSPSDEMKPGWRLSSRSRVMPRPSYRKAFWRSATRLRQRPWCRSRRSPHGPDRIVDPTGKICVLTLDRVQGNTCVGRPIALQARQWAGRCPRPGKVSCQHRPRRSRRRVPRSRGGSRVTRSSLEGDSVRWKPRVS